MAEQNRQKPKKKNRRAYLNDFKKNSAGNYEYQGALYEWEGETAEYTRQLRLLGVLGLAASLSLIFAGCLSAPGMLNCVYVILPYTVSFVCGCSTMWALVRFLFGGKQLRGYIYEATVLQIPNRAAGTILAAVVTALNECIYLFLHGSEGHLWQALVFLGLILIAIGSLYTLSKKVKNMKWEKK